MQQVNLYTDAFRPKKVILPLAHIIALPICVVLLLGLATYYLEVTKQENEAEIAKMTQSNQDLQERVEILDERAGKMRKDDSLVAANERLSQRLVARQDMVEMLESLVVRDDDGFSEILLSLARQNIDSLWLQRILITSSGEHLRLEGHTKYSESVPVYLQRLRQEQSFIGRTFKGFELNSSIEKSGLLSFSLYTSKADIGETAGLSDMNSSSKIVQFAASKAEESK